MTATQTPIGKETPTTIYTAPNGTADVVMTDAPIGKYVVRYRTSWGAWHRMTYAHAVRATAVTRAKEIDRFKPDGSGRF